MKFPGLNFFWVSLLLLPLSGFSTSVTLQFFEGRFSELKTEAAQKNLPYLVYCYREDSLSCSRMARETFTYAPLVEYADGCFLPYRMSGLEVALSGEVSLKVEVFPSILVFGPDGKPWGQFRGFLSGPELLIGLRQLRSQHAGSLQTLAANTPALPLTSRRELKELRQAPASAQGNARGSFLDPLSEKELALAQAAPPQSPQNTALPAQDAETIALIVTPQSVYTGPPLTAAWREKLGWKQSGAAQPISLMSRYDLGRHLSQKPFGVEIGRFTEEAKLLKEVKRLQRLWKGDIWIHEDMHEGKTLHHLILGSYESADEALAYARPIRRLARLEAEVVDFRHLLKPNL